MTFPSLRYDTMFCDFKICSWCETVVWLKERRLHKSFTHISQRERHEMILSLVLSARFWKKSAKEEISPSLGKKFLILLQLLSLKSKYLFSISLTFLFWTSYKMNVAIHLQCNHIKQRNNHKEKFLLVLT